MNLDSINLHISIRNQNFDINQEIKQLSSGNLNIGGIVSFLGIVRDLSKNNNLKFMEIEHYPGMTETALMKICNEAKTRWEIQAISVIHRIGKLYPGDNIVLLLVGSVHRTQAFEASEFVMDFLKSRAPFWKKETTLTEATWIEENPLDEQKLLRW